MAIHQPDIIEWHDEVPVSTRFGDPYYSVDNGLAESAHVFLKGNGLPDRFVSGFHIAELGFGTGLNLLVALDSWRKSKIHGPLIYTSFEAYPLSPTQMIKAHRSFSKMHVLAAELAHEWDTKICRPDLEFNLIVGDARDTLKSWDGEVDAWFLDGFSPAKNPELWEASLLSQVGKHTKFGGTFATYTAAGFVRRSLQEAKFEVERTPGYGRKRHMARGIKL
jgi:tRNA U34 5-methylaminomethyl-2-thiouridine-forming methyltransferase MnmC